MKTLDIILYLFAIIFGVSASVLQFIRSVNENNSMMAMLSGAFSLLTIIIISNFLKEVR